jgi:hypothetical protein
MKALWNPPPGISVFDSRCAVLLRPGFSRTVLGCKGSLRRGTNRRALAPCAPFRITIHHDGRLRRESKTTQVPRLAKDENQFAVDKTS